MNNFASIFEELSKLYEEEVTLKDDSEEKVEENSTEELTEAAEDEVVEFEVEEDEIPAEEVPAEEPTVEDEPRRIILECEKCGALVIKDEADVVVDEETDLANVEDACEYCDEADGYKIVGVVAPYDVVDEEVVEEENSITEVINPKNLKMVHPPRDDDFYKNTQDESEESAASTVEEPVDEEDPV